MRFRVFIFAAAALALALAARAGEPIPVYGAARVAVEDADRLKDTVLGLGVLAVTPGEIYRVFIGDGITPGGHEIHPKGCVRDFRDIHVATTNLDMNTYSVTFGPWNMSGDIREFDITWGGIETWLRLIRDTDEAHLRYNFTIGENNTYKFAFNWSDWGNLPVLHVSTNLLEGYFVPDQSSVVYERPTISRTEITYTAPAGAGCLFFCVFAQSRMSTGAYLSEHLYAENGITVTNGGITVSGGDNHTRMTAGSVYARAESEGSTIDTAYLYPDGMGHQHTYNYWRYNFPTNSGTLALTEDVSSATNQLSEDIAAAYATTGSVASVERRVGCLERTDTCSLWWSDDTLLEGGGESDYNWIPTNFPTPKMRILVYATSGIHNISLPADFIPGRQVSVQLIMWGGSANTTNYVRYGTTTVQTVSGNLVRTYEFAWDVALSAWMDISATPSVSPYSYSAGQRYVIPPSAPATVSQWLVLHPEWADTP